MQPEIKEAMFLLENQSLWQKKTSFVIFLWKPLWANFRQIYYVSDECMNKFFSGTCPPGLHIHLRIFECSENKHSLNILNALFQALIHMYVLCFKTLNPSLLQEKKTNLSWSINFLNLGLRQKLFVIAYIQF